MAQMEFHRLLTHQQARADLRVRQSLHAAQGDLGLPPAQVLILNYPLYNSLKGTISHATLDSPGIRLHPALLTSRNNFLWWEDPVGGGVIACPIAIGFNFALHTELGDQSFEATSDRAQADNAGKLHQGADGKNVRTRFRLSTLPRHGRQHRGIEPPLHGRVT